MKITSCRSSSLTTLSLLGLLLLCAGSSSNSNIRFLVLVNAAEEENRISCTTANDCDDNDNDGTYCASDGTCTSIGRCAAVDDCSKAANKPFPFPIAACMGTMECQEGTCAMNCDGGGTDAIGECSSTDDCAGVGDEQQYCASNGVCLGSGMCTVVDDCADVDNEFPVVYCMGTMECQEGMCAMNCNGGDGNGVSDDDSCAADTDCDANTEYCAQGTCTKKGMCISDSDCFNPNHTFADVMCIGYQYCDYDETNDAGGGFCARKCGEQCKDGSQMTEDCTVNECDSNILYPGAVSCRPDSCNECKGIYYDASGSVIDPEEDTTDGLSTAEGSDTAVDADAPSTCTSDADCISVSISRMSSGSNRYCAQGTCMDMGSCLSDTDCYNPINIFHDKRCAGYLTCDDSGMCDRICGEWCKNGSEYVGCPDDYSCNVESCPGSVSCQSTSCDGVCKAVYFDAAGEVLTDCDESVDDGTSTKTGSSSSISSTTEKEADAKPTDTLMNSGGVFQTMILSASAIFVTSFFLTV